VSETKALLLSFAAFALLMAVAIFGLRALDANEATLSLGFLVPLILGSYTSSRVVMHYSSSDHHHR
jgi:hypothetical protein